MGLFDCFITEVAQQ